MIPTPLAWAHSRARSPRELVSKPIAGGRERGAPPPQRAENARRGPRPRPAAGPSPVTALVGPRTPWGCSRTGPAPDTVLKPVLLVILLVFVLYPAEADQCTVQVRRSFF